MNFKKYQSNKKSIILILLIFILVLTIEILYMNHTSKLIYKNICENTNLNLIMPSDNTILSEFMRLEFASTLLCLTSIFCMIAFFIYVIVSNQKKNEKMYNLAYIDSVTGLGNELFFKSNGSIFISGNKDTNKYIVTIDINKFKALNKIYNYEFCNVLLRTVGHKLKSLLPEGNITCRISNDIFAGVFSLDGNIDELLNKISESLSSLEINGINIQLNLSIGAYNILPNESDINKILDKSYLARLHIKGLYYQNYYLYDEALENKLLEIQNLESHMKSALENQEFVIYYQPKIFAKDGSFAGAEALVRWNKNGEMIPPNKFIPLFEKNKFIIKLDLYVFEKVCKDLAKWQKKYGFIPTVSINASKEHFVNENFINQYVEICNKYNLNPSNIDLEITESATVDENIDILKILNKIKEKGFIISLDDFGTGYSSLSMLQSMPIDIIKIDKVFVDKADLNSDSNIINHIVIIAEQLGVKTIVEGIETKEQVDFINRIHADIIQGYYFSKPLTKEDFEKYFEEKL